MIAFTCVHGAGATARYTVQRVANNALNTLRARLTINRVTGCMQAFYSTSSIQTVELSFNKFLPSNGLNHGNSQNTPLLILPGLFGSKQNWRSLSKSFAQRLDTTVVPLDLRNHGDSPHHSEHSYIAMSADVDAFVTSQGWSNVNVMGHSMGGKVAMHLALLSGHAWLNKLIVVDMPPVVQSADMSAYTLMYIQAMRQVDDANVKDPKTAEKMLSEVIKDVGVRQFIMTNLKKQEDTYKFRINLKALEDGMSNMWLFDFDSNKSQFNKPTMFICGGNSTYVTPDMHPTINKFFPAATITSIADAGHWLHAEKPEEFTNVVVDFLKTE